MKPLYLAIFILGLICSFGQPPFNYISPSLCSIALFIVFLEQCKSLKESFKLSFFFGYGYYIYSHNWFSESLLAFGDELLWLYPFGLTLIPAFFALYFSAAGMLIYKYARGNIFLIALIWLSMELIRSYGYIELPWLLIGYIWSNVDAMSQTTSLFGIYGLSFLTIIWALAIKEAFLLKTRIVYIAFISFIACYSYGLYHLQAPIHEQNAKIRIVQPNLDRNVYSRANNRHENLLKSIAMSQNNNQNIDYIIWPEGSNEYNINEHLLTAIKNSIPKDALLIFNASRTTKDPLTIWNSLFIINSNGTVVDYYDKVHLVPLGEYIPLRSILPFIDKITPGAVDYSKGSGLKAIKVKHPFMPNICYESIFSENTTEFFTWIVNSTNDGWFGDSIGPKQHLAMSRFRSIEQGVPTARAALTGISAAIDSFGHIIKYIPLLETGILDFNLPGYIEGFTPYHHYGHYILILLILLMGIALHIRVKK